MSESYRALFEASPHGVIVSDVETRTIVAANTAAGTLHGYAPQALVGRPLASLLAPDSANHFPAYLEALQTGTAFDGRAVHMRRDGSAFDVEVHVTAFVFQQRPCLLSSLQDVSQQVRAEGLLEQKLEARTREQSALAAISQTLAAGLELKPGLILDQLAAIIDYTRAGLFVLAETGLTAVAMRGQSGLEAAVPFHIPVTDPETVKAVLNGPAPTRCADVLGDSPHARLFRSLFGGPAAGLLEGMRACMWLPLAVSGRLIGGVCVARPEPDVFVAHQAELAQTVANQAAIALANAELYEQARALAGLQERQRLARNLHDAVNQSLFSAGLIAEVLPRLWERDPDAGRRALDDLRRLTRGALAELRALLAELRPAVLVDTDLADLLRQLANAVTGRTAIPVAVAVAGQGSPPPSEVRVAFYRLCQEALSNVVKHAAASQVVIQLQLEPDAAELRVRDDGCGFDPAHTPSGGTGLSIMRERAEAVGAALTITSRPGAGAEVLARWKGAERNAR